MKKVLWISFTYLFVYLFLMLSKAEEEKKILYGTIGILAMIIVTIINIIIYGLNGVIYSALQLFVIIVEIYCESNKRTI